MANNTISSLANNQIQILEPNGDKHFKSYETTIANIENGKIKLNKSYYEKGMSATTTKYLGLFLGIGTSGVKKYLQSAIESGLIELTNDLKKF